jgi:predicted lipid-binding transport protein (Tim44 family)
MRRALRSGSILGATTVGLTVVSTLILLLFRQGQSVVFETAYTVNIICYAIAAFRAVRFTGNPGAATLDAAVAATWAGALGTVLQGTLLGTLDGGILIAVLVMLLIEWVSALIVAPVCGAAGLLSRKLVPGRAQRPAQAGAPSIAAKGDASAA